MARRRPSAWWFALGAALLLAAGVVFGVVLWRTLANFTELDATVPADGAPHAVAWAGTADRMLWVRERDDASCTVTDPATGLDVAQGGVTATYTRTTGGTTWVGRSTFSGASGRVEVTCASAYGPAQIGPAPSFGGFAGGIAAAIGALVLLGLGGLTVLVVTGILWATRGPRRDPGAPPATGAPAR